MALGIVCFAMLFVFFIRDVQLLKEAPHSHLGTVLGAYTAANGIWLSAVIVLLASGDPIDLARLVHSTPIWILCVLWHGLIWLLCRMLNRHGREAFGWVAALVPAPVLWLALSGVALFIRDHTIAASIPIAAIVAAGGWCASILLSAIGLQNRSGMFCSAQSALDFAGMTNVTALILIPFAWIGPSI
jgi:hypothetical protein